MSKPLRFSIRCLAALLCSAAVAAHAGVAAGNVDAAAPLQVQRTDRLIVHYRDGSTRVVVNGNATTEARTVEAGTMADRTGRAQQAAIEAGTSARLLRQTGLGSHVFKFDRALPLEVVQRIAARLKAQDTAIDYAEPDRLLQTLFAPNDTNYSLQWDLYEATGGIRAPAAWDLATGTGVVVAVVDTGIRPHAELSGQTVAGYDMISMATVANDGSARDADASDPGDWVAAGECGTGLAASNSSWHGTHVAGTIGAKANNASGVAGIAFNARVQPVRVLGKCGGYISDISDGIVWASGGSVVGVPANATPARVVNLSLGGSGACDATTQAAINSARARGTTVVVAAGNSAADAAGFTPASCSGVIAVAATDRYGARAYYSNFGAGVALAAPGGDTRSSASGGILSTFNTGLTTPLANAYAYYQGTSMAAPHVSGVVALMLSAKPGATPDQIAAALKSSARAFPGVCAQCGAGLLDAQAAVTAITTVAPGLRAVNEVESNDTLATANWPQSPAIVNGAISWYDADFFRVDLPAGKTLAATLTAASSLADYDLYFYTPAGAIVASSQNGPGQSDAINYVNGGSATVTLYVRVYYYSGGAGNYALKLQW